MSTPKWGRKWRDVLRNWVHGERYNSINNNSHNNNSYNNNYNSYNNNRSNSRSNNTTDAQITFCARSDDDTFRFINVSFDVTSNNTNVTTCQKSTAIYPTCSHTKREVVIIIAKTDITDCGWIPVTDFVGWGYPFYLFTTGESPNFSLNQTEFFFSFFFADLANRHFWKKKCEINLQKN